MRPKLRLPESLLDEVLLEKCLSKELCKHRNRLGFCKLSGDEEFTCEEMSSMTGKFVDLTSVTVWLNGKEYLPMMTLKVRWIDPKNMAEEFKNLCEE